uniref:Uncharacterized protein n=1 Tax=Ascaris lumbricoides TaxID=6252 RepID=A0A0M3IPY7_ASCLU
MNIRFSHPLISSSIRSPLLPPSPIYPHKMCAYPRLP